MSTRTIKLPMGEQHSAPSYNNPLLSAHALFKRWPSGRGINGQHCGKCGKSHEWGNCPVYGKTCSRCQGIIILKLFVIPRLQPRWHRALTEARSHSRPDVVPWGATMVKAKEVANKNQKKKTPKKPPKQNAYAVTMKNSVPSGVTTTSGGEREKTR